MKVGNDKYTFIYTYVICGLSNKNKLVLNEFQLENSENKFSNSKIIIINLNEFFLMKCLPNLFDSDSSKATTLS